VARVELQLCTRQLTVQLRVCRFGYFKRNAHFRIGHLFIAAGIPQSQRRRQSKVEFKLV
jgi:hypothetical protein